MKNKNKKKQKKTSPQSLNDFTIIVTLQQKVNLCSKLKIKNTGLGHWHRSDIFVNFEQIDAKGLIQEKTEKSVHNLADFAKKKMCLKLLKVFIF